MPEHGGHTVARVAGERGKEREDKGSECAWQMEQNFVGRGDD